MTNFILKCHLKDYVKMHFWVQHCDEEAGGPFAIIEDRKNNCYTIKSTHMVKQTVSSASIDYEDKAYSEFITARAMAERKTYEDKIMEFINKTEHDKLTDVRFSKMKGFVESFKREEGEMYGQWHSHVNMGCTPSGTDINNAHLSCTTLPFLLMLIMNKSGNYTLTRFENGVVQTKETGVLHLFDDEHEEIKIGKVTEVNSKINKDIIKSIVPYYPSLAVNIAKQIEVFLSNETSVITFDELEKLFPEVGEQCAKDIIEYVFSKDEYEINDETGEIEKRTIPLYSGYKGSMGYNANHYYNNGYWKDGKYIKHNKSSLVTKPDKKEDAEETQIENMGASDAEEQYLENLYGDYLM